MGLDLEGCIGSTCWKSLVWEEEWKNPERLEQMENKVTDKGGVEVLSGLSSQGEVLRLF